MIRQHVRKVVRRLPPALRHRLRRARRGDYRLRPRWGNLRSRQAFSHVYGWDRGTPVDRIYIERFLSESADAVRGRCLEVKDAAYTQRFGRDRVIETAVVDIDPTNLDATVIADLCAAGSLPTDRFDCVVLTQTLHVLADPGVALQNLWDGLRPGGVALLTVPTVAPVDKDLGPGVDVWRWTPASFRSFLGSVLPDARCEVRGFGNLVTVTAMLHGVAAEELHPSDFDGDDERYPLIAAARVERPA